MSIEYFFKGWAKPGPTVPGALDDTLLTQAYARFAAAGLRDDEITLDYLSGHYRIFQLRKGHRFSTDDLLVAWYGTSYVPCARRVLDLGSGIGSVGMIAAWRLQGAHIVTIEAQAISACLAAGSALYNGLTDSSGRGRYDIRVGDFRDASLLANEEPFDLILGSPPYFAVGSGQLGDHSQKIACRFETRGTVADYCRTAAQHLAPGGLFTCIFPLSPSFQYDKVITGAAAAGLIITHYRPVIAKAGALPLFGLFAMMNPKDMNPKDLTTVPPWQAPPLTIRTETGEVHPEYTILKQSLGFP